MSWFFSDLSSLLLHKSFIGFALTGLICWAIIRYSSVFLGDHAMHSDTQASQAMHRIPTPRIGGAAIVVSLSVLLLLSIDKLRFDLGLAILAGTVVFLVGLKEDVSRNISPMKRLLAAFVSAGIALYFSSATVSVPNFLDFAWVPGFGILIIIATLVWAAGTCHALNLIDGLNGLCSGYAITAFFCLYLIAGNVGETDVQFVTTLMIGTLFGFFIFNWFKGSIFLGDSGAYAVGHMLAWIGIILMARHSEISPFAMILILFWPVAETLFSLVRRKIKQSAVDAPDRMHFHHLVVRSFNRVLIRKRPLSQLGSWATLVMIPMFTAPALFGVLFWNQSMNALIALLVFTVLYVGTYRLALTFLSSRRSSSSYLKGTKGTQDAFSKLSGDFTQDAITVRVQIRRLPELNGWALYTEAANATGRKWETVFATERDAWTAFLETIRAEGMKAVVGTEASHTAL